MRTLENKNKTVKVRVIFSDGKREEGVEMRVPWGFWEEYSDFQRAEEVKNRFDPQYCDQWERIEEIEK